MASDYNAKLISDLYSEKNSEKATRISNEMTDIGDAIFPRQIFEAYKRFKSTFVSHYFISDLIRFKTVDATEIIKEIADTTDSESDLSIMIGFLSEIGYFEPSVFAKIVKIFRDGIDAGEIYEYHIDDFIEYLLKSGMDRDELVGLVTKCFEDDRQETRSRKIALKKLLKIDAKGYLNKYYNEYTTIKGKKAEIIFVEEISTWHGGVVPALHEKILRDGSDRAKEILLSKQKKNAAEKIAQEAKEQSDLKTMYETADVIGEIANLRGRINKIFSIDVRFRSPIFSEYEDVYTQNKPAKDKATLVGCCMVIRTLLSAFSDCVTGFNISDERAKELIPGLEDFKGSINKFHLLLLENHVNVDSGIFGLRTLNRFITKFAAHTGEERSLELVRILQEMGLQEYYENDNWSKLHRTILEKYKEFLEKLLLAISKK